MAPNPSLWLVSGRLAAHEMARLTPFPSGAGGPWCRDSTCLDNYDFGVATPLEVIRPSEHGINKCPGAVDDDAKGALVVSVGNAA